ncbi:MAG: hypothetical protein ABJB97_01300 [Acidobacteriota bacterium]
MSVMFSRWRISILTGIVLLLVLPSAGAAQRRRNSRKPPTAQPALQPPVTAVLSEEPKATTPEKASAPAAADTQAKNKDTKGKDTKGTFKLKVAKGPVRAVNLKADRAQVAEIAAQLEKNLDVPVLLSPVMQKAKVTIDFVELPLETALRMIAPQPYVDYELSGDGSTLPKVVAIYLYAVNEPPPAESAVVRGDSEAILISGDTEEGTEAESEKDKQEKALSVKMERNQLTVHARKQPLTAVLYEIASKVDIPFEMKYDSTEVVNIDLSNATMEQVVRSLSPNIRLYQRTDLQTYETRPLRLVLAQPTSQTIKM